MADDKWDDLHKELEAREAMKDLPISKLLVQRVEDATSDGEFDADDVVAPIISAIVSLELLIREGKS